jgi:hypothetical protein
MYATQTKTYYKVARVRVLDFHLEIKFRRMTYNYGSASLHFTFIFVLCSMFPDAVHISLKQDKGT